MKPPQRLLEDPGVAPALRSDLERTAAMHISYDAGKGLAALQAAVTAQGAAGSSAAAAGESGAPAAGQAASGSGAAATTTSAALFGSAGAKLALVASGAAVIAAGVIAWPDATPVATAPAQTPAARATETPEPGHETTVAAEPDAIDLELSRARAQSGGNSDADAALRREIAELGRIKALLAEDPAQAYRLAQAGHRTHPAGMLRHEREGLAIFALWNLDRRREATARTRAFLERYPTSPLRAELARELERASGGGAEEPR
jgi:hypothetical protein